MNTTTLAEKTQLQQLQEQRDALAMQAEIAGIEAALRAADLSSRLVESEWGELVNRREYLSDTPGFGRGEYDQRATSANDRVRGKLYPIFENEQDLAWIRGVGRFIASHHEIGVGILENLISFTLGNGLVYEPQSRRKGEASPALLTDVSAAIDEFHEANGWTCEDGSNSLEEELLTRDVVDGEFIVWVDGESRVPRVRIPEPDFLTEPADVATVENYAFGDRRHLDWSFGVASHQIHTDEQVAYYFQWEQASQNWDVIGAHEVVHSKRNVPRRVKRGVSDFFAVYQNIERASKLLGNTLQGSAVQATIAYIREHVAGTPQTAIESFANGRPGSVQQIIPKGGGATRTGRTEKFNPGRVIDTAGTKYHAGPLGQSSAPTYVDVMQAALRVTGVRWSMPEHMVSGDASNANYSSTLVAGGPFDRATQRRQGGYKGKFGKIHWMALAAYCKKGRFARHGIYTLADLKAAIELAIDAPDVSIENKMETEQIRDLQAKAGILSKRSWAGKAGLDWEQEQASIKAETPPAPPMVPGAMQPGQQQQPASPASPVQESMLLEGGVGSNQYVEKPGGKMDDGSEDDDDRKSRLTKTPSFKKWFGNSVFTDENDEPLVLYHGTGKDFTSFKGASYFTPDQDVAEQYGSKVVPVFIAAEKVFRPKTLDDIAELTGIETSEDSSFVFDELDRPKVRQAIMDRGYHAIRFKDVAPNSDGGDTHAAVLVFDPKRVKAAYKNRGTFDPASDNITESRNSTREAAIAAALESCKSPQEAAAIMRNLRESYP